MPVAMLREHLHILHSDEDLCAPPQLQLSIALLRYLRVHDRPILGHQFDFHERPGSIDVFDRRTELRWLGWLMFNVQKMGTGIGDGGGGLCHILQRPLHTKCPKIQRALLHASMKDVDLPEEVIDEGVAGCS
jgi:hypothetical protein